MENDARDYTLSFFPPFGEDGHLPPGVHSCDFRVLAKALNFNAQREKLWSQLVSFLALPILSQNFTHGFLGGDYVSNKSFPKVTDLILKTRLPYGPDALAATSRYFAVGIERFCQIFDLNLFFWIEEAPEGLFDGPFFSSRHQKTSDSPFLAERGVVRIILDGPGALQEIRRLIRSDR